MLWLLLFVAGLLGNTMLLHISRNNHHPYPLTALIEICCRCRCQDLPSFRDQHTITRTFISASVGSIDHTPDLAALAAACALSSDCAPPPALSSASESSFPNPS